MAIADEKKVKTPSLKKLCSFFQVCLFLYYPLILSIHESCSVNPSILLAPMIWVSPTDFLISALFSVIISRLHLPLWDFFALCFLQVIMSRREFWFPPLNSKKKKTEKWGQLSGYTCLCHWHLFVTNAVNQRLLSSLSWNLRQLVVLSWKHLCWLFLFGCTAQLAGS